MPDWLSQWTFWLAVVLFLGTAALVPIFLARMPADYFVRPAHRDRRHRQPVLGWLLRARRTVLGIIFIAAGLAMLVLPGQGILTILAGLMLLDFPGKRELELRLIRRPGVLRAVNWMRAKTGRPPLVLPDGGD